MNRKITILFSLLVLCGFICHAQRPLPKNINQGSDCRTRGTYSFETKNYPGHFLSHREFFGLILVPSNEAQKKSSTFKIVNGLAGDGFVSFESVDYPNHYFRHQNEAIKLHKKDGTDLFKQDASFRKTPGLAGVKYVSFESCNYPDHFIRHKNWMLLIEKREETDLFKDDSSFIQKEPLNDDED